MNQTAKEFLRAQFVRAYFRDHKTTAGKFMCIYCGEASEQNPENEATLPTVANLIPRKHKENCPVAAKIKELEL